MYCTGLPELTREPQPGPLARFGTSIFGSVLSTPSASPPMPGVKGTPVLASSTPPSCHPPSAHASIPDAHLGVPSSQVKLISRFCAMLKSESPRFNLGLKNSGLEIEFVYSSPTKLLV